MKITKQQRAMARAASAPYDWNGVARAGAGKTFALVNLVAPNLPTTNNVFVAFGRQNAAHFKSLLPPTTQSSTIHSLALKLLRSRLPSIEVDSEGRKDYQILKSLSITFPVGEWKRYIALVKACLSEDGLSIRDSYGFEFPCDDAKLTYLTTEHLNESERLAIEDGYIDFNDMVWLAAKWGLGGKPYDCVLIDERQDLTPAQVVVVSNIAHRTITVGDDRQTIFQFAGAGSWSPSDHKILPLTVTWRCPSSHVALAQKIVPDIEPRPKAPKGIIDTLSSVKTAVPGDLILCRVNAPLIGHALQLIRQNIPAHVRGRDIGAVLRSIFEVIQGNTPKELLANLLTWKSDMRSKIISETENPTTRLSILEDRYSCLRILLENVKDRSDATHKLSTLFSDDPNGSVILSSIHRAKGLEAPNIFILYPDLLHCDSLEESNITYVALTRSKDSLFFLGSAPNLPST